MVSPRKQWWDEQGPTKCPGVQPQAEQQAQGNRVLSWVLAPSFPRFLACRGCVCHLSSAEVQFCSG